MPTVFDNIDTPFLENEQGNGRLRVKLFLRHALHAKLYLAHWNDTINPIIAYLGSSKH